MAKLAIVGSRTYRDLDAVRRFVASLPLDTEIVSGGATGVDQAAEGAARQRGLAVKVFFPDWSRYGKRAGYLRNIEIVDYAEALVAYWDLKSRGTAISLTYALDKNKLKTVWDESGREVPFDEVKRAISAL